MSLPQLPNENMDEPLHVLPQYLLIISEVIDELEDRLVDGAEDVDLFEELALDEGLDRFLVDGLHDVSHDAAFGLRGDVLHLGQLLQDGLALCLYCTLVVTWKELEEQRYDLAVVAASGKFLLGEELQHCTENPLQTDRQDAYQKVA